MATSCKHPVYRVMCEADGGRRRGKYGIIHYESTGPTTKATSKAKAKKKTTTTTKKKSTTKKPKTVSKYDKELDTMTSAYFKAIGKDVDRKENFAIEVSLGKRWMKPTEAKETIAVLIKKKKISEKDGWIRPNVYVDVPRGWTPDVRLILRK